MYISFNLYEGLNHEQLEVSKPDDQSFQKYNLETSIKESNDTNKEHSNKLTETVIDYITNYKISEDMIISLCGAFRFLDASGRQSLAKSLETIPDIKEKWNEYLSTCSPEDLNETLKVVDKKIREDFFQSLPTSQRGAAITSYFQDDFNGKIEYYMNTGASFIIDVGLEIRQNGEKLQSDEVDILTRLIVSNHLPTIDAIEGSPLARTLLQNELKRHVSEASLPEVMERMKSMNSVHLLRVLVFIRENREQIITGKIGSVARSRPDVRKIKKTQSTLAYDLEFCTTNGNIVVNLGFLGKGQYKVVQKILQVSQSSDFSLDVLPKQTNLNIARREGKLMKKVEKLPNVMGFKGTREYYSIKKGRTVWTMVNPLYDKGELDHHLSKGSFDEKQKLIIVADILRGIKGLHEQGIIHRDIKTANIFLQETLESGKPVLRAYVGDLGLSCSEEGDAFRYSRVGSPLYMPPEVLSGSAVADFSMDAWGAGVVIGMIYRDESSFNFEDRFITNYGSHPKDVVDYGKSLESEPKPHEGTIDYVIWKLMRPKKEERMVVSEALGVVEGLLAAF